MEKTKISRLCIAVLSLLLVASAFIAIAQNRKAAALADSADATMRRAMYESAELLGGIQGGLLKLPAASGAMQEQVLLGDIAKQAFGVQENLAALPADAYDLHGAIKFVNQVQDYAEVLTLKIARGESLSEDDLRQIADMAQGSLALQEELLSGAQSLSPIDFSVPEGTDEQEPAVEYPTLIYDGSFSDGAKTERIPVQGGDFIDAEEAKERAAEYFGAERIKDIRLSGETALPVECYEFEIDDGRAIYSMCITKTGGEILYMLCDAQVQDVKLTESECIDIAYAFLFSRGYGPMQQTYWSAADGFCTINFAAVQDNVLLYPDLVKVDIAMDTGDVCGIEAKNYLANHVQRGDIMPEISREEAQNALNSRLNVTGSRLCIIPTDMDEKLAWEFSAEIEGIGAYLVYIDAATGDEIDILRLVETESGLETQ